ncbi:MAG: dihydroorotase [Myxococcota bacterium]
MSGRLLISDVRLFDPGSGLDVSGRHVLVDDGVVADLNAPSEIAVDRRIAGGGRLLCPGFIDLRAHLGEPGFADRETIATGGAAAAAGGFTTVVTHPNTEPTTDRVEVVETIKARAREADHVEVLPAGTVSVERKGQRLAEFAKLRQCGCVLFTDGDRPIRDARLLRYALETADDVGVVVATHSEDETLAHHAVMHEGRVSTRLGLMGAPGAAEQVGVARDLAIAELTGARLHIAHITTAGSVDLIRQAKRRGARVTADASPHYLLLTDEALSGYDTAAKLWPPLRPASDVDAVVEGLADGTLDLVASDHEPRTPLEKNVEVDRAASGAVGFELVLAVLLTLVREGRLTLQRALSLTTRAPSEVLGRTDLGRIAVGGPADLVLVDPESAWTVGPDALTSRSKNTPLTGMRLYGQTIATIRRGRVVFQRGASS